MSLRVAVIALERLRILLVINYLIFLCGLIHFLWLENIFIISQLCRVLACSVSDALVVRYQAVRRVCAVGLL